MKKHITGAKKLAKLVSKTAGAMGNTVWIERQGYSTKDGFNITKDFQLKDKEENIGASILKQSALNTMIYGGDGTTLTCILASALLKNANLKTLDQMKESIEDAKASINRVKDKVRNKKDLYNIAYTSSNGDKEIASKVSDLVWKIGKDGLLIPEQSYEEGVSVDIIDGFSFNSGYLDGVFMNTSRGVEHRNPITFIQDRYNISDVKPFLNQAMQEKRPIILFGIPDDSALVGIIDNHRQGNITACCVPIHGTGKPKERFINDLEQVLISGCEKIVIKRHQTIIQGFNDMSDYADRLKEEETPTKFEKDEQKERIARLTGKIGIIRAGAKTQAEERERLDRIEDSIRACQSALEDGYVIGGGYCLDYISRKMTKNNKGSKIVANALKQQYIILCKNAQLKPNGKQYNLRTRKECDLLEEGIVDSSKCIKLALDNAFSVAKELIKLDGYCMEVE